MQIWIDGDACPVDVKELLFRTAERRQVKMTVVANSSIRIPRSEYLSSLLVPDGANVADRKIVELLAPGDLVVTADVPLAADVIAKGGTALDPRGELHTEANIGQRLAMRNLLDQMRGSGEILRGPRGYSSNDRQAFANSLDRWLTKAIAANKEAEKDAE
ncbi:YaiI/YqxD family protein [Anatilimnocola floriformis]|uniref:YaiI/YqxD family protein n=1 Tax=Anatilimnocola floriformis TaxID=2948575 RepID=UPI0020C1EAF1|nr:YaiI/YqxD family protein [Anatilimnocola floriformis]